MKIRSLNMGHPTSHVQSHEVNESLQNGCQQPRMTVKKQGKQIIILPLKGTEKRRRREEEMSQYNGAKLGSDGVKFSGQGRPENILRMGVLCQGSCINTM